MSFVWSEFQKLAEELRQRDEEAAKRTAVSRIYYAVYHKARIYLEKEGFVLRSGETAHKQIWDEFKFKGRTFKAIFQSGSQLHQKRIEADYFAEITDLDDLIDEAFDQAEKIQFYFQQIEKKDKNK